MRTMRLSLLVLLSALSARVWAQEMYQGREVASREALVRYSDGAGIALSQSIAAHNLELVRPVGRAGAFRLRSRAKDVAALLRDLRTSGAVVYAEPNYIVRTTAVPNDPMFRILWGLRNTGQPIFGVPGTPGAHISATAAWDVSTGNRNAVVGVVDTGIDYNHPDLVANVWSAPTDFSVTIGGMPINCLAGTHGFNAITDTCIPLDDNNHGTHVSGTIGATGNNGAGVTGVNWATSIMGLKFLNAAGNGSIADAIDAIEFAIQVKQIFPTTANVRVLNNSWGGGGFSQTLLNQINAANAAGILFVAAAGNDASDNDLVPAYPGNYDAPNVVAVAATTNQDTLADFSNYGATSVDLGAPGDLIASTIRNGNYSIFSGTSMAAPHVSGAAMLVLSQCALDTAALKSTLLSTVDVVASLVGWTATGGRLNVDRAIRNCGPPPPGFTLSALPASATVTAGGTASYTVSSTPTGGFAGSINLSASGLPAGAVATFGTNPIGPAGSSSLDVSTLATTPAGTYTLTITGTEAGGSLVRTAAVTLIVNPVSPASFTLSASPASVTIAPGGVAIYTISVLPVNGFSAPVALSVNVPPSAANFTPPTATSPGYTSVLRITPPSGITSINVNFTVTGTGGGLTRTTSVNLRIVP